MARCKTLQLAHALPALRIVVEALLVAIEKLMCVIIVITPSHPPATVVRSSARRRAPRRKTRYAVASQTAARPAPFPPRQRAAAKGAARRARGVRGRLPTKSTPHLVYLFIPNHTHAL